MISGRALLGKVRRGRSRAIHRILIVEDEALVAFDNEHMLVHAGYVVAGPVDDYHHAIAAIDAGGIDLVIADINLRGDRNGIDVARHAHAVDIPVLFVAGACPVDAHAVAIGCLAKPFSQRDLLQAIDVADALVRAASPPRAPVGMHLFPRTA